MSSPADNIILWKQFCLEQSVKISQSGEDGSTTIARAKEFYDFIFASASKIATEASVGDAQG